MALFTHPGPQTLQCWAWVQLVLGTEGKWGLEFLRGRINRKERSNPEATDSGTAVD